MSNKKFLGGDTPQIYTLGEEIIHSVSHGVGVGLSIAGLTLLVTLAVLFGNGYQVVSFSVYGSTLVALYLSSTLYHSFQQPRVKKVFKTLDHVAIYLLIAGTYTPFLLVKIGGMWGGIFLGIVWGTALLGAALKVWSVQRFRKLSVVAYILLGWLSLIILPKLWSAMSRSGLKFLFIGGAIYTVGVIFYSLKRVPYMHAVWHLFVLAGSICHYFAVLGFIRIDL
ncbi:MAG: hemolysin III [Candidatus Cloacimonetes bacterium 4572_55]|nr:MAG: hemolysin III [Candidatus Cloacimonetes bacterium 4572_55]